jgi:hypothetical protein
MPPESDHGEEKNMATGEVPRPAAAVSRSTNADHTKEVVRRFAEAINARDWDGPARVVFPDARETMEDMVAEGDRAAVLAGLVRLGHCPHGVRP